MLNWLKRACLGASLMTLAACVTPVSRELAFDASSGNALLVVASPNQAMASYSEFRRVNLETQRFEDEIVAVTTAGLGPSNVINYSTTLPYWLSMVEVPPGDYALVSLTVNTFNGVSQGQAWLCMSGGPVFHLRPGQIAVVSTLPLWRRFRTAPAASPTAAAIFAEFERARSNYPNITGEAVVAEAWADITWQDVRPNFLQAMNHNCIQPELFELSGGVGAETKPVS